HISEFLPLWRTDGTIVRLPESVGLLFMGALTMGAIADRRHRVRGAVAAVLAALAVLHVRHIEQFGVLGAMLLAPWFDQRVGALVGGPTNEKPAPPSTAWALAVVPGLMLGLTLHGVVRRARSWSDWIAPSLGGPDVVTLARALDDGARAYAPFLSS